MYMIREGIICLKMKRTVLLVFKLIVQFFYDIFTCLSTSLKTVTSTVEVNISE